ncbi:hypothetical protein TNCV_4508161 [Trichonephila clavipes]|nr:hypothetical protein TNCV_4508161 [Trichonephila clavipes]
MTPKSPNCPPTWSPKMMPTWLYRQDFAKFSLNRHYNNPLITGLYERLKSTPPTLNLIDRETFCCLTTPPIELLPPHWTGPSHPKIFKYGRFVGPTSSLISDSFRWHPLNLIFVSFPHFIRNEQRRGTARRYLTLSSGILITSR